MSYLFDGINHPTVAQVQAVGAAGCLMYGGTPGDGLGKDFTAFQYSTYKAAGLLCAFVYENTANDMGTGMAGGAAHADALLADLHNKGVLSTEPIGVTVDEHVTAANIPLAVQYQTGFYQRAHALGWAGARGGYGFSEFLIAIHDAGVCDWFWGAGTRSSLPPYTNIWQDNTGTINVGGSADDRDWILVPLPTGGPMTDPWATSLTSTLAKGTPEYALAISQGATPNPDGTITETALARDWLTATANRVAVLESVMGPAIQSAVAAVATQEASDHAAELTTLAKEEADFLGAIKALPAPVVQQITADPTAVATQLITAGLPADLVGALMALLQKAAPTPPAAS